MVINDDTPFFQQKAEMLNGESLSKVFRVQTDFTEPVFWRFISFLRFAEFDENIALLYQIKGQWQKENPADEGDDTDSDDGVGNSQTFKADDVPPLSRRNERRAWQRVKELAINALNRYPQTLEQDNELLAHREELTFNEENCVLFRAGEKEILHYFIEFADHVLDMLELKFAEAKKKSQHLPVKFETTRDYVQN